MLLRESHRGQLVAARGAEVAEYSISDDEKYPRPKEQLSTITGAMCPKPISLLLALSPCCLLSDEAPMHGPDYSHLCAVH